MSKVGGKKNVVLRNVSVDLVIDAVRCRPPLWDARDENYKNKMSRSRLWNEVTSEANLEINESNTLRVRKSWETLKATYIRSKKRTSNAVKKEYKHAKALSFLDGLPKPKRPIEDFEEAECCDSSFDSTSMEYDDTETSTPNENKILGLNYDDETLDLERRYMSAKERRSAAPTTTMTALVENPPDAIHSFLSSLHPYLETLGMTLRLEAQHNMLKVLLDALKKQEDSEKNN